MIDEGIFVPINRVDQWITIRGDHAGNMQNPALLMIGGPGAALSLMAPFFAPWENSFTLVQWDQPGAGATFAKNGDLPLSYDCITRDGIAVVEFVRRRLGVEKIVLLGISGGTIVALVMVKQRPDLFSAYVGTGQVVNWARQEALSYAMLLEREDARAELERIGPPPYKDSATDAIKSKYASALTPSEQAAFDPAVMAVVRNPPAGACYIAKGFPPQDPRAVAMAAYDKLRGELTSFDARELGTTFDVPMFFFQGALDAYTVTSEVVAYEAEIQAPVKRIVLIPGGGHSAVFMRDEFLALLNTHVRERPR